MKKYLIFFFVYFITTSLLAQDYSLNVSYQLGRYGEYYGVSASKWIKTWNNNKVVLRGAAGFFAGTHWGEKSNISEFRRIELGLESRNTIVTGKDFFNIINVSYLFTTFNKLEENNRIALRENGWMFSFGFGTKLLSPVYVMAKYVWRPQRGIRLGIEYDFQKGMKKMIIKKYN